MSFFSRNNKKLNHDNAIKMAKEILDNLGYERKEYSSNLEVGKYYYDYVYEDYYFKIVRPDKNKGENTSIYVLFNGYRVIDDNTFISGMWEELFIKEYKNLETKANNKKQMTSLIVKQDNIISLLDEIKEKSVKINDNLRIEKYSDYSGYYYEHYNGTTYRIYHNEDIVFYVFKGITNDKCYAFVPGLWEEEIRNYVELLKENKFEFKDDIKKLIKTNNKKDC